MKEVIILGIETSCDETSAALVINGRNVLSNIISSQIDLHKKYGGVVPEIASRKHVELIIPVINQAIIESNKSLNSIDAIAVTYGPGLVGALLVGLSAAKSISYILNKPLIAVNHIKGHIAANYIQHSQLEPPFVCLVVSGGHSHIVYVEDYNKYEVIGQTRDDAAGEAFDKVARVIGLSYPGGPVIDKISSTGNSQAIDFPRTIFQDNSLDFSFSGIKTSVLNYINSAEQKNQNFSIPDVCASFQQAVVDVLVKNLIKASKLKNVDKVALAGGVAANSCLRNNLLKAGDKEGLEVFFPKPILCTDNAAMIASAGYYEYIKNNFSNMNLNAMPSLRM